MPWDHADHVVAGIRTPTSADAPGRFLESLGRRAAERLAAELSNQRDAAARWCSTTLLAYLHDRAPDLIRATLGRASRHEPCRENLRAYAAVLAEASPLST